MKPGTEVAPGGCCAEGAGLRLAVGVLPCLGCCVLAVVRVHRSSTAGDPPLTGGADDVKAGFDGVAVDPGQSVP